MKKIVFSLAFMLIGSFAFASNKTEVVIKQVLVEKEISIDNDLLLKIEKKESLVTSCSYSGEGVTITVNCQCTGASCRKALARILAAM